MPYNLMSSGSSKAPRTRWSGIGFGEGGWAVSYESSRTPTQPYTAAVACLAPYNNNEGVQ